MPKKSKRTIFKPLNDSSDQSQSTELSETPGTCRKDHSSGNLSTQKLEQQRGSNEVKKDEKRHTEEFEEKYDSITHQSEFSKQESSNMTRKTQTTDNSVKMSTTEESTTHRVSISAVQELSHHIGYSNQHRYNQAGVNSKHSREYSNYSQSKSSKFHSQEQNSSRNKTNISKECHQKHTPRFSYSDPGNTQRGTYSKKHGDRNFNENKSQKYRHTQPYDKHSNTNNWSSKISNPPSYKAVNVNNGHNNFTLDEANEPQTKDWENISDEDLDALTPNTNLETNTPDIRPGSSKDLASELHQLDISDTSFSNQSFDSKRDSSPWNDIVDPPQATNDSSWISSSREKVSDYYKSDTNVTRQPRYIYDRLEKIDKEYKEFKATKFVEEFKKVQEVQKDLFSMDKDYSMGHCVAEDMRMGSGIAVTFKQMFKSQDDLLDQKQKSGGLAIIKDDKNKRYIYYLVTKKVSNGKPTYETLWSSLQKMRDHMEQNKVKKLAIPRLGCGLDRLEWRDVKQMIEFLFKKVDAEIVVCNFQQSEESSSKPLMLRTKLVNVIKPISDIEHFTMILYFSTEDGHVSEAMLDLDKKFNFLRKFKQENRRLGSPVRHDDKPRHFILYGCIVRKTIKDHFDFKAFTNCIKEINKNNKADRYEYIAYQAFKEERDEILNDKILTIMRNYLKSVDIYVCWPEKLVAGMPKTNIGA